MRTGGESQITGDSPYQRRKSVQTPEEEAYSAWLVSRIGAASERLDDGPVPDTTHRQ
ncbi:hypothetical protein D3C86_2041850 [compost metagenome]